MYKEMTKNMSNEEKELFDKILYLALIRLGYRIATMMINQIKQENKNENNWN